MIETAHCRLVIWRDDECFAKELLALRLMPIRSTARPALWLYGERPARHQAVYYAGRRHPTRTAAPPPLALAQQHARDSPQPLGGTCARRTQPRVPRGRAHHAARAQEQRADLLSPSPPPAASPPSAAPAARAAPVRARLPSSHRRAPPPCRRQWGPPTHEVFCRGGEQNSTSVPSLSGSGARLSKVAFRRKNI
eukprot:scaffold314762_cov32-Tisochrysis_lutea.AAC.1